LTSGPFAWSRNPIYLGEASLIAGFGLLKGSLWLLIAAITFVNLVTLLAVIREEAHLAARFGEDWQAYVRKVRRWL
jgi:protein-S-isoprenylcysteine O-methyltransferase Ste14